MLPVTKSTIRKIYDTWSTFCGTCFKYGMGYKDYATARHALAQHWAHFKKNPGRYPAHITNGQVTGFVVSKCNGLHSFLDDC